MGLKYSPDAGLTNYDDSTMMTFSSFFSTARRPTPNQLLLLGHIGSLAEELSRDLSMLRQATARKHPPGISLLRFARFRLAKPASQDRLNIQTQLYDHTAGRLFGNRFRGMVGSNRSWEGPIVVMFGRAEDAVPEIAKTLSPSDPINAAEAAATHYRNRLVALSDFVVDRSSDPTNSAATWFLKSEDWTADHSGCLLYTSPSPRDATLSRMPSSA